MDPIWTPSSPIIIYTTPIDSPRMWTRNTSPDNPLSSVLALDTSQKLVSVEEEDPKTLRRRRDPYI